MLLKKGANIHATTTRTGESALHLAARYGDLDTIKVLLEHGADPNKQSYPLNPAFAKNRAILSLFSQPRNYTSEAHETPLHVAAECGQAGSVSLLLEAGANITQVAKWGTVLHYAIKGADSAFGVNSNSDYLKTVKILLENGADPLLQAHCITEPLTPLAVAQKRLSSIRSGDKEVLMSKIIDLLRTYNKPINQTISCNYRLN